MNPPVFTVYATAGAPDGRTWTLGPVYVTATDAVTAAAFVDRDLAARYPEFTIRAWVAAPPVSPVRRRAPWRPWQRRVVMGLLFVTAPVFGFTVAALAEDAADRHAGDVSTAEACRALPDVLDHPVSRAAERVQDAPDLEGLIERSEDVRSTCAAAGVHLPPIEVTVTAG